MNLAHRLFGSALVLVAASACGSGDDRPAPLSSPLQDAGGSDDSMLSDAGSDVSPDVATEVEPDPGGDPDLLRRRPGDEPFLTYFGPYEDGLGGTYQLVSLLDTGRHPELRPADLDGDGTIDLVSTASTSYVSVFFNSGSRAGVRRSLLFVGSAGVLMHTEEAVEPTRE